MTTPIPSDPWKAAELAREALDHAASNAASNKLGDADLNRYGNTLTAMLNTLAELVASVGSQESEDEADSGGREAEDLHAAVAALNDAASHIASYTAAHAQMDRGSRN